MKQLLFAGSAPPAHTGPEDTMNTNWIVFAVTLVIFQSYNLFSVKLAVYISTT